MAAMTATATIVFPVNFGRVRKSHLAPGMAVYVILTFLITN